MSTHMKHTLHSHGPAPSPGEANTAAASRTFIALCTMMCINIGAIGPQNKKALYPQYYASPQLAPVLPDPQPLIEKPTQLSS